MLRSFKDADLEAAMRRALTIDLPGISGAPFRMVPMGPWIADMERLLEDLATWRNAASDGFLFRKRQDRASIWDYYSRKYALEDGNILFLLVSADGDWMGHLGITGFNGASAELDNVIKSPESTVPGLFRSALQRLIQWCVDECDIEMLDLTVLSNNVRAIRLYEDLGFVITGRECLERFADRGIQMHRTVGRRTGLRDYQKLRMTWLRP